LARNASESARSLPQAAGDRAGELCLSPVGLTLVTRIAPVSMAAMLMGVWFRTSRPICGRATRRGMLESEERGAVSSYRSRPGCCSIAGLLCRLMHGRG